jgi:hypothetical protein
MTKEECLKLPPRKREVVRIPVPSRHEMRYTQALKDLAEAVETSRRMNFSGENDDVLSSFQRLRQISAFAKGKYCTCPLFNGYIPSILHLINIFILFS